MQQTALRSVGREGPCPNPYRCPPTHALVEARDRFVAPLGFEGRAGALVYRSGGALYALYAVKPNRTLPADYRLLTPDLLWPTVSLSQISEVSLVDGTGKMFSFRAFLAELLGQYLAKGTSQGGSSLAWRKGELLYAMQEALKSPAVQLLVHFNRVRTTESLVAIGEWHIGQSEAHEMRREGVFYAPLSSGKRLLTRLLVGHAVSNTPCQSSLPIPILYEDDVLLIANKPPHLPSVSAVGEPTDCLTRLIREHGPLYDVHRLDMATSGILVFAKMRSVQKALQEAFRKREVLKTYIALLEGAMKRESGTIDLPLGVNRLDRPTQCVIGENAGGKRAETQFQVLQERRLSDGRVQTLVSLIPQTGRTHQLRVHCAHRMGLDVPIVGDPFYGCEGLCSEAPQARLYLHATRICFQHPTRGETLEIESKSPF